MITPQFLVLCLGICLFPVQALGKVEILKEAAIRGPNGSKIQLKIVLLTFPKSDEGLPVHVYSGKIIGYVLEGEFLLQVKNGPLRILSVGEKFSEEEDAKHIWNGNASNSTVCKVIAAIYAKPGEPIYTFLDNYPRDDYTTAVKLATRSV